MPDTSVSPFETLSCATSDLPALTGGQNSTKPLSETEVRAKIQEVFQKRPCDFQYNLYCAQLSGKNIISVVRTGSGKTLTYLMPLVTSSDGIIIIVTALNVLGEQFEREAKAAGFLAKSVNGENDCDDVFKDIRQLKYCVVIFSPDIMMKRGGRCQTMLWPNKTFTSKLQRIVFDEAHCIVQWGSSFRPEYKAVTDITFHLPGIPVYLSSATIPPAMVQHLKDMFRLSEDNTVIFQRTNDRPNIAMVVRRMQHAQNTYEDLAFLVPKGWKDGDQIPKKFMVFFDNKKKAEAAAKFLQSRVSLDLRRKIPCEVWGFAATDSGGMGLDVPNIAVVVQWKVPSSLNTLIQRFGRAACDYSLQGVAILIAEPSWFYEEKARLQEMRAQRTRTAKRKPCSENQQQHSNKRARTHSNIGSGSSNEEVDVGHSGRDEREAGTCILYCICLILINQCTVQEAKPCCERCEARPASICCDICHSDEAAALIPTRNDVLPPRPKTTRKIKVKAFTMLAPESKLRDELFRWRDNTAKAQFADYKDCGGDILMHYKVLERIIELAHIQKLNSVQDIHDQTGWCWTAKYGQDVLNLVRKYYPGPAPSSPFTTVPLETNQQNPSVFSDNSESIPVRQTRASPVCGACSTRGHRSTS
ncbi:P-loop containing nucleoside triphosphate hydrolase protein [Cytidiella melzeri]|nr:P-loop containing nucleoside triphosphate hydrolase protein [Cytidiella melzeri]